MVECSPGPEGGLTPPHNDSTGNSLENGTAAPGSRVLGSRPVVPKNAGSRVIPFIRSNSDGSIGVSISQFPIAAKVHPGRFHGAGDRRQKQELIFGGSIAIQEEHDGRKSADESDTFLSASMQLMHLNGEARQRVRQLWTSVQRLGRENQISESGMDVLYVDLSNILKSISAEKLEGTKPLKSGYLVLLASSPASDPSTISSGAAVKALFGSRPTAQLMQCTLSEDQSKFEMTPVRQAVPANAQTSTSNRFGLPSKASLMGMISEAFQEEPTTRAIKLQGCQVRRLVPKSPSSEVTTDDGAVAMKAKILHRFQLLVPDKTQMSAPADGVGADILFPTRAPVPYESFIFEVPVPTPGDGGTEADFDAQAEVDDWVLALDRVCRFQLHRLEHALREAPNLERYRETLQRHFPVSVSVSWLRNRVDQPTLQRRASANLSMIQIVKDLGRDKVLLDDQLFSAANPYECDDMESDSVSEVVKYMVKKVLQFEQDVTSQTKEPGKPGVPAAPSHQPSSPAHRFAKNCEARALAFVERVLQGSSRTQSGGDIYDAISFFCQQEHVSICPVSQDARPVQMRLITDVTKGIFQVEVQVCMQFKVIELTPRSPTPAPSNEDGAASFDPDSATLNSPRDSMREWAVLEGTLSREFTLGKLAAPGTVTINCTSSSDN
ncbi:hypothetical protein PR003_g9089 [Phytophthora rubi]|uniref:Uncharacterized protein n=1 Tax=Phytophthora rubi TaxID=129364 RepID=A0A6A3MVU6_9STRA|nr:hypothetical protein PR002_g8747 [Phytophthora rubi]KAE9343243.1 hypothetical protein PR003_g9089 [Phytophthora rubi]